MVFIEALADIGRKITFSEVEHDVRIVTELLDYLRWLAEQNTGFRLTAGQVWELYHEGVRRGRVWSEVCEDLDLPVRLDW